ncbi:MAG: glyoxalase [Eubacterium sp.]|nr:glyoxalase [Eubacterium sp.]
MYEKIVLDTFLEKQLQLFPETVAEDAEEADDFLDMMMAVVCKNLKEVKKYLEDSDADIVGMSDQEIEESAEVFKLPDGRYLVVL